MTYTIHTKGFTEKKEISDIASCDTAPYKTLGSAIEKIFEILEYQVDDIAEIIICNEMGKELYRVKPTGIRAFHVSELF